MGKKKYIKTPELYLSLWNEYVKEIKSKPKLVHDFVGKDGESVYRERERPLSWDGFELFVTQKGYMKYPDLTDYCDESKKTYKEYLPLSRAFKKQIKADQIEGGMTNIYNANITARLNGLKEQTETEIKASVNIPIPDIGNRK